MSRIEKKIYLKVFSTLAILLSIFYVSVVYLSDEIKLKTVEIIEKKEEIKRLDMQNKQINNIKENYQKLESNIDKISSNIIEYSEIYNFITEVKENVTDETGVKLIMVSKDINDINKELSYINYSINITGDFNQIMHFFDYMENLKYKNDIENITVSSNNENINIKASLKVYAWK
ncbi:MAG: type 4a pilus biogenesis protein PilO [Candidatus Pacebacteria bacterium]|nr:type 4a pilus biogenesis protein PilO [Candidatus Paceibacterota bacterium]